MIRELEMNECADQFVGDTLHRGLSGGETKRLCIGIELISNPTILFLDEPTTGLDVHSAENVMRLLKRQTQTGRIVITTIHQPSSEIFELFNYLMILHEGQNMYYGKAENIVEYFAKKGFDMPQYNNPADFFLSVMTSLSSGENSK